MLHSSSLPAPRRPRFTSLPAYRAVLEELWRQQVAEIITLSYQALTPDPDAATDRASVERALEVTARRIAASRQPEETEAALGRVDDGSYGLCGSCRDPITVERLEVLPAARYCVGCDVPPTPPRGARP